MRGRDGAVRLHDELDDDGLAAGVGGGLAKGHTLPGDGVLDGVAGADHLEPPCGSEMDGLSLRESAYDPITICLRGR